MADYPTGMEIGPLQPAEPWIPQIRSVELAPTLQLTNHPLLSLQLVDMPRGGYNWYLVLTEPDTTNVVAKAQATFSPKP